MVRGEPLHPRSADKIVATKSTPVPPVTPPEVEITHTFEERGYYAAVLYRGKLMRRIAGYVAGYANQCIGDAEAFVTRYGIGQDEPVQVIVIEHVHHYQRTVVGQRVKTNFSVSRKDDPPEYEDLYGPENNRRLVSFYTVWSSHTTGATLTTEQAIAIIKDYA